MTVSSPAVEFFFNFFFGPQHRSAIGIKSNICFVLAENAGRDDSKRVFQDIKVNGTFQILNKEIREANDLKE